MNKRKKSYKKLYLHSISSGQWVCVLVVLSILLVLLGTLVPFQWSDSLNPSFTESSNLSLTKISNLSFREILDIFLDSTGTLQDLIVNVLLFLPLGFGVAAMLWQKWLGRVENIIVSGLISLILSLTIETFQLFLPARHSSIGDILTNTTGGILGAAFFHLGQSRFFSHFPLPTQPRNQLLSPFILLLGNFVYLGSLVSLFIALNQATNLSNWDTTFPLVIGNERTGDRPWNGLISQVYIANQSLAESKITQIFAREPSDDLVNYPWTTDYLFSATSNYHDQSKHLPDLVWQETAPTDKNEKTISVSQQHWLTTQGPATELIQAIQETSQFSLLATIATANPQQSGPARIISISTDPFHRNLTIGQQGSQLVVRLRTLVSGGANGSSPELIFPGIFKDTNSHRLLLNYDKGTVRLYSDDIKSTYSIALTPEILFFRFLPTIGIPFQVTPVNQWIFQVFFYILICIFPAILGFLTIKRFSV